MTEPRDPKGMLPPESSTPAGDGNAERKARVESAIERWAARMAEAKERRKRPGYVGRGKK